MTSNQPSLIIRLYDDFIRISCDSTNHLYNVCFDNNFINENTSLKGGVFEVKNLNELDGFGDYLRSKGYPYALFRMGSDTAIDYWYPTARSELSTLSNKYSEIDEQEIDSLRSCGYVTIEDINRESRIRLESIDGVSGETIKKLKK